MSKPESIKIDDVEYVRNDSNKFCDSVDGMPYQIVRTYSAGVFVGYVKSRNGQEVVMTKTRRIWYWNGANSLSELAVIGTLKPADCKFACEANHILINAIEILDVTDKAKETFNKVGVWQK